MIEEALIQYETSRQNIAKLRDQITSLHSNCKSPSKEYNANEGDLFCPEVAWAEFSCDNNLFNPSGYGYQRECSYDEILEIVGCDNCKKARKIKLNELALSRQQFGIAKRRLSHYGKKLINNKGQVNE